jgi:hypothetical protein
MTNPSRSLSKGREAVVGSSLRVESAFMLPKPAMARPVIAASAPPATIASASPSAIRRKLSPIACAEDAHADTVQ